MQKTDAKTLQRRIAQHPSVLNTRLFYVDGGRIYTNNRSYDAEKETGFALEIQVSKRKGICPEVMEKLVEADVSLRNSLVTSGMFRTVP